MLRTFVTDASDLAARTGQSVDVVRIIRHADASHDYETLPMFVVRFSDGTEGEAWRDELRPFRADLPRHCVGSASLIDWRD